MTTGFTPHSTSKLLSNSDNTSNCSEKIPIVAIERERVCARDREGREKKSGKIRKKEKRKSERQSRGKASKRKKQDLKSWRGKKSDGKP